MLHRNRISPAGLRPLAALILPRVARNWGQKALCGLVVGAALGSLPAQAQVSFAPQSGITPSGVVADNYAADLDGDGDADVLAASGGKVVWFESLAGNTSGPPQVITTAEASRVYATDLDGDSDVDVLSASSEAGITWFENLGAGAFGPRQVVTTDAVLDLSSMYATDLNGDGHADVLWAHSGGVGWYKNLGSGTFGPQQVITAAVFRSVYATDLDGDGDADVLAAGLGGIGWYENLGSGTFGLKQVIEDESYFLHRTSYGSRSVYATDLDGDGDADVLSGLHIHIDDGDAGFSWNENLGNGSFGPPQVIVDPYISPFNADDSSVYAMDLDGDGDADVLGTWWWMNTHGQLEAGVSTFENLGHGSFALRQSVAEYGITKSLYAADSDGDGDADMLLAANGKLSWQENLGDWDWGPKQVLITELQRYGMHAADLDGDGDTDVLSAGLTGPAWYENLGSGAFGPEQVISTVWTGEVYATDLDGDGDVDVLSAGLSGITWVENLGAGAFGPGQVITTGVDRPESIYATDLDGDGDADVLSAYADHFAPSGSGIEWVENLGGGTFGPQQVISTAVDTPTSIYATDLDGDGDVDVLSASSWDHKIAWYENLGSGAFGPQQVITTAAGGARSVYAADLDGDGDADVLSASSWDYKIAWYENLGSGAFGPQQVITTAAREAQSVYATDLDGDGDADVLSAHGAYPWSPNVIAWFENLGSGSFGPLQEIEHSVPALSTAYATDLDNDGDADVLSFTEPYYFEDSIVWYENLFEGRWIYCTPKLSSAGCATMIGTSSSSSPVSGAGDYSVTATNVQGHKNGILFAGTSGSTAVPFLGGTLCVHPPVKRGVLLNAGGSSATSCDGSYATVVNDGLTFPLGFDVGPGDSGWYQWWYRDPNNGEGNLGTALSNAVQLNYQ